MKVDVRQRSVSTYTQEEFGVHDRLGRQIGARIATFEIEFVEAAPESMTYYLLDPGTYYGFVPHATRNGKTYGASQDWRLYRTASERDGWVAIYLEGAKRRAMQKQQRKTA